jgi:GNAT superfamily N-acetyltransferase
MRLRPALASDWPVISELRLSVRENRLSNPGSVTQAMYDEYIGEIGRGWVAELDGRIEGFCIARDDGYIWALFVRPGFEGRGLARALMGECVTWLVGLGVSRAELETGANTRAEAFYRRAGWREVGRRGADITFCLALPTEA